MVARTLFIVIPGIRTESQSPVIDKAYTTRSLSKLLLLFSFRVKPECVRFLNHGHTLTCICVILKSRSQPSLGLFPFPPPCLARQGYPARILTEVTHPCTLYSKALSPSGKSLLTSTKALTKALTKSTVG